MKQNKLKEPLLRIYTAFYMRFSLYKQNQIDWNIFSQTDFLVEHRRMSRNSHNSSKPSVGGFKLSSNFSQLYTQKKEQAQQFIKDIQENNKQPQQKQKSRQKSGKKAQAGSGPSHGSLFKLNTQSEALVDEVPVQALKKKSQFRLQSIQDSDQPNKARFNLLDNQSQRKQSNSRERKQLLKKYNIDLNAVMNQQNTTGKLMAMSMQSAIQQQDPQGTVKPSQLYSVNNKKSDPFITASIFQTPLLPCFSSQFISNPQFSASKTIRQGQGVWRIGKIKINRNKATLKIGQIQYESQLINGEGKCIAIKQDSLYKLKNWNGIWVSQPKQQNF